MPADILARYTDLVTTAKIENDPAQRELVEALAALERQLGRRSQAENSWLGRLFLGNGGSEPATRGIYVFGDVGRGKTMLMDLFFATAPVARKRRVHFDEFMLDVHDRVHKWRQQRKRGEVRGDDPIAPVAGAIAREARLLCLDEFHVTDIADAMILGRLFTQLFGLGVVPVITSNVAPDELYEHGLNRALFLPFIALLKERMQVVKLEARTDFRMEKLAGGPVWYVPADAAAATKVEAAWQRLTAGERAAPIVLTVNGRPFQVPAAAMGAARFSFDELCRKAHGAADYLKLAQHFHSLVLERVPRMRYEHRNEAKRFITLIDALYDNAVKLIASADAPPDQLYQASEGVEALEFHRTASRLTEMQSDFYLALPHARRWREQAAPTRGIIET